MQYLSLVKDNLPVYGIAKAKNLRDFCTTEKDVTRGISRVPLMLARLLQEDILVKDNSQKYVPSPKNSESFLTQHVFPGFLAAPKTTSVFLGQGVSSGVLGGCVDDDEDDQYLP